MIRPLTIRFIFSTFVVISILSIAVLVTLFFFVYIDLQRDFADAEFQQVLLQHAEAIDQEILKVKVNTLRLKDLVTTFEQSPWPFGQEKPLKVLEVLMAENLRFDKNQYNSYFAFEKPKAQKYFGQDGFIYTVHKNLAQLNTEAYGQPENRVVEPFTDPLYQTNEKEVWYHIAKRSQNVEITPLYFDATYMKTWLYTVGVGLYEQDKFQGMVGIDILAESFFEGIEAINLHETGGLFLADRESGVILTKVGPKNEGRSTFLDVQRSKSNLYETGESQRVWQPILQNDVSQISVTGKDGQPYMVSSRKLNQLPVTLVAYGAESEMLSTLYSNLLIYTIIGFVTLGGLIGLSILFARNLINPLNDIVVAMETFKDHWINQSDISPDGSDKARAPIRGTIETRKLGEIFNEMAEQLEGSLVTLEQRAQERTAELQEVIKEGEYLQQQVIEAQRQMIHDLSSPIIPIMDQIIVMPLVGNIDSDRSKDITRGLLAGIGQYRANVVILDITGVPLVDSGVANHLNRTIQAARLKGAQVIVTGVSDAMAETMVELGIDWSGVTTLADLQGGLSAALVNIGFKLSKK